jgi:hypothetical protein
MILISIDHEDGQEHRLHDYDLMANSIRSMARHLDVPPLEVLDALLRHEPVRGSFRTLKVTPESRAAGKMLRQALAC